MIKPGVTTRVHLVRHGEVDNPSGVLYGRLPGFVLSEAGHEMARNVAKHLAGRDVVHLVSSPLERAQQTSQPTAEAFGLPIVTDHRVIESTNRFEGTHVEFGPAAIKSPKTWPLIYNPFKPSWGEPYIEIADRMLHAVDDARAAAAGHEAVIISHQLPVWTTYRRVEGMRLWHRPDRRRCALGSITTLVFDGDTVVGTEYAMPSGPGKRKQGNVGA